MNSQPSHSRAPDDGLMNEIEDHDKGLAFDLPQLITRRRALGLFAGRL